MYKYVGVSGSMLLPIFICDQVPNTLFDTTSLGQDYLHEAVSIQDRAHITDVGSSPLISRSHYENMWARAHKPASNMSVRIRPTAIVHNSLFLLLAITVSYITPALSSSSTLLEKVNYSKTIVLHEHGLHQFVLHLPVSFL